MVSRLSSRNIVAEIKTINNNSSRDSISNIITKIKTAIPKSNSFTILTLINNQNPTHVLSKAKIWKLKKNWPWFKICQKNKNRRVIRKTLWKKLRMKRKRKKVRVLMKSKLTRSNKGNLMCKTLKMTQI